MRKGTGQKAFDAAYDVVAAEQCEFCRSHDACCETSMYEVDDIGMQDFSCINFSGPDDGPGKAAGTWWDDFDEDRHGSWRSRGLMAE